MVRGIGRWLVRRFGERYTYDVGYMEKMLEVSPGAFWRFVPITGAASYHRAAPEEAYYAVKLMAASSENCGPCTQLVVEMVSEAGVVADQIRAVLVGQPSDMTPATETGYHFGYALAYRHDLLDPARDAVRRLWGEAAVVELSLCFAVGRVFPTTKLGMGAAAACRIVTVLDQPVRVMRHANCSHARGEPNRAIRGLP